jgi:uncharacterized protein with von Willebrand factor type A (vWA) domain
VLDRSGSMDEPLGDASDAERPTRYEEAVERMAAYLDALGEEGRFDVVLFDGDAERWRGHLVEARGGAVREARGWSLRHPPGGGTRLRDAVESALEVAPDADTLVVLCDGRTDEGPHWVVPTLRRLEASRGLVVHAVRVGAAGDGTLEALTRETGGDLVRVDL